MLPASSPAFLRGLFRAGLAVTVPVLLTGCGELSGGTAGAGGPGFFNVPSGGGNPGPVGTIQGLSLSDPTGGAPLPPVVGTTPGPGTNSGQRNRIALRQIPGKAAREAPRTDSVPGPLPLFGVAAAFGCSRRLRRRLQRLG